MNIQQNDHSVKDIKKSNKVYTSEYIRSLRDITIKLTKALWAYKQNNISEGKHCTKY